MCDTPTTDVRATLAQIARLSEAGCQIVRLGIPDSDAAKAVAAIKRESPLPIVADIHFDHKLALIVLDGGVDALRINPGNLKNRDAVREVVRACKGRGVPIRIGVNAGSIDRAKFPEPTPEALVDSAWGHIRILEDMDFTAIKVSLKASDVKTTVAANRLFASQCGYPLHLGVTEAGTYEQALAKSAMGIGALLIDGIGDTIRVSITGDVVREIDAAKLILRCAGVRNEGIEIVSCPTCARKEFDVEAVANEIVERTRNFKGHLKVAVMGCIVNGPGEACDADVGIAVGKTGASVFKKGEVVRKVEKSEILDALMKEIEEFGKR
jgi:(E)-4-hydroxy-3-methylbut-2-enyl-diphosphate synthase